MRDFSSICSIPKNFGGKKSLREKAVTPSFHILGYSFLLDESNLYCSIMYDESSTFVACLDAALGTMKWILKGEDREFQWVDLDSFILVGSLLVSKIDGQVKFDFNSIDGFVVPQLPNICQLHESHILFACSEDDPVGEYIRLSLTDFTFTRFELGLSYVQLQRDIYYGWKKEGGVSKLYSLSELGGTPIWIADIDQCFDLRFVAFSDGFLVLYDEDQSVYFKVDLSNGALRKINLPEGVQGTMTVSGHSLYVVVFGRGLFTIDLRTDLVIGPVVEGIMEWSVLVEENVLYTVERRGDFDRWDMKGGDHFICARETSSLDVLWDARLDRPGRAVLGNSQGLYVEPLGNAGVVQFFGSRKEFL